MNVAGGHQEATCTVDRNRPAGGDARGEGMFVVECYDKDGNLKWTERCKNQIKDVGAKLLLDVAFHGTAAIATWYIGLAVTVSSLQVAADTMGSHTGWTESTAYAEATRVAWNEGAASGSSGVILNTSSSTSDFTMNATATIDGIFISSDSTKGGTTGTLWCTAPFTTQQSLVSSDVLKVSYTFTFTVTGT